MDDQTARDYDYVEWNGRTPYVANPLQASQPVLIDTTQIWMSTERELRYWTSELGATVFELREAIEMVGSRCAGRVRAWLESRTPLDTSTAEF